MALGILLIFEIVLLILFLMCIGALVYDGGKLAKKPIIFGIIIVYALILAFLSFTALPSNFIGQRIGVIISGIIGIVSIGLWKKKFSWARILITISMISSLLIMNI
ncbi:hypothetical protein [Clostridium sp. B9]|uniref:hypothetical protein n=1 Tax=Clostridium sp. B9 TaxID=3423224 RepID=UPI003D2F0A2C